MAGAINVGSANKNYPLALNTVITPSATYAFSSPNATITDTSTGLASGWAYEKVNVKLTDPDSGFAVGSFTSAGGNVVVDCTGLNVGEYKTATQLGLTAQVDIVIHCTDSTSPYYNTRVIASGIATGISALNTSGSFKSFSIHRIGN